MVRADELPAHPVCPHCGTRDTSLMSPFGSVLANAQYYCRSCRTPFELVKWRGAFSDGPA